MATVKIDSFGGIAPRMHPTIISDGMAVTAHNCRLKSGKLVPIREPLIVSGIASHMENGLDEIKNAHSIHVWRKNDGTFEFILFPGLTWIAPGNVADDSRARVIISGDTGAEFTDVNGKKWSDTPMVYLRNQDTQNAEKPVTLCMNEISAPKVERASGQGDLGDQFLYTRFFYTWTDEIGRESPCSPPSLIRKNGEWVDGMVEYLDGDSIVFAAVGDIPEAAVALRVWKVVTGNEDGYIQFVKEVSVSEAEAGFTIAVRDESAGETIPEIEAPPPDLRCIHDVPGGYYCGMSPSNPKTVFFSDVNLLYSWPVGYRYDVTDRIVTLAVTSNTVFALTEGWPYVLSGTAPESMTVSKLAGPAACVSERGVVVYKNAVYYVSNIGLMSIHNDANSGTVCANITDKMFTKDQWEELNPASCVMVQYDGALHMFFTLDDGSHKGLVVDLQEAPSVAITTHNEIAKCACIDDKTDKMYFVKEDRQG